MSDDNVVIMPGPTRLPIPVERVLDNTPRDMESVVIIGYDADGEFYFASSQANGGNVLWLLETAKIKLMKAGGVE